jgi:GTP-binding protein
MHPIQGAEFALAVANDAQLPPPGPFEIAFAGRSNAGKSSAINALANRTRLAFTSKTPGRTQQIVFFRLRSGALLADLPGYGYAAVPQALKRHWQNFLARYVATRQSLVGLVLVVDARHGLSDLDRRLLAGYLPSGRPLLVLATKIDKLGTSARAAAQRAIERDIAAGFAPHVAQASVVPFSATHREGVDRAEATLAAWLGESAEPAAGSESARARHGAAGGHETSGEREPAGAGGPAIGRAKGTAKAPAQKKAPRSRGVTRGRKRLRQG